MLYHQGVDTSQGSVPAASAWPSGPGSRLTTYCQAIADGTVETPRGLRGLLRRALCLLVRTHRAGVPF